MGGGTDLSQFSLKHGGRVLNLAINLRHTVTLTPRQDDWIWIEALGESRTYKKDSLPNIGEDPKFDLTLQTIKQYNIASGFRLVETFSGAHGAGLGSSASACVSTIGALNRWLGIEQTKLEIAQKAQEIELSLGWVSGCQDQIAAAVGGVNEFVVKDFPKQTLTLVIPQEWLKNFALFYTGKTRHSHKLQQQLVEGLDDDRKIDCLTKLRDMVPDAALALALYDVHTLGNLLDDSWFLKQRSNPNVTNPNLDKIYTIAKDAGALGGKVLGAGGEGHMFFICTTEGKKNVVQALEAQGIKEIDFSIDYNGLEVRKI